MMSDVCTVNKRDVSETASKVVPRIVPFNHFVQVTGSILFRGTSLQAYCCLLLW